MACGKRLCAQTEAHGYSGEQIYLRFTREYSACTPRKSKSYALLTRLVRGAFFLGFPKPSYYKNEIYALLARLRVCRRCVFYSACDKRASSALLYRHGLCGAMSRARPVDETAKAKSRINMWLVASAYARRQKPMVIQESRYTCDLHENILLVLRENPNPTHFLHAL